MSAYEEMLAYFDRLDDEHHGWSKDDDFVRYCCGDPDCENGCERETPPPRPIPQEDTTT